VTGSERPDAVGGFARVVVDVGPVHLDRLFDYAVPEGVDVGVGSRVRVRFNGRPRTAWVAETSTTTVADPAKVKPLDRVDGDVRWFDADDLRVWRWVADRYGGTMSGAIRHALPPRIVRVETESASWGPPAPPTAADRPPCAGEGWRALDGSRLLQAAWTPDGGAVHLRAPLHPVAGEGPLLADLVARCVAAGRQALVLVPSPAPGPADDVVDALGTTVADLRGPQTDADRYRAFLRLRRGDLQVAVGERGLALLPLPHLGLIVVVDEASPAYKEQRNPRHHARDAALGRARISGATAVLTSSVLSAQARRHAVGGHLALVRADRATERAQAPAVQVIDRTALPPSARRTRLVGPVSTALTATVADGGIAIVLAAAKGSGTSLACADCRARHECPTCGGGVSPVGARSGVRSDHAGDGWSCTACGWQGRAFHCTDCGSDQTFPLRAGAGRFASELARTHPDAEVVHMEGFDQPGPTHTPAIAVMTRGSVVHRPDWLDRQPDGLADLLVIADPDVLLGRPDVEAAEDALRLWLDAARLARKVLVQTAQPTHPALQALVRGDPDGFWTGEHDRRAELGFPPAGALIRLTSIPPAVAAELRRTVPGMLLGPDPDGAALLKTADLRGTLTALRPLQQRWALEDLRIRVDVDPVGSV
jgi:primosomal protein N' (replication factor Y) (superfamily II helicase)